MLVGVPAAAQEHASRSELLLSVFLEFWLADGDCPLPSMLPAPGSDSAPSTPSARSAREPWKDYNDSWGGLLSARSSSLRRATPVHEQGSLANRFICPH